MSEGTETKRKTVPFDRRDSGNNIIVSFGKAKVVTEVYPRISIIDLLMYNEIDIDYVFGWEMESHPNNDFWRKVVWNPRLIFDDDNNLITPLEVWSRKEGLN